MKKIYYEKVGRRYVPVSEYDSEYLDSFSKGTHIVMCYPGGQSRRYNIDPNYAAMIAAGRVAEDAISKVLMRASDLRPKRAPLTEGQRQAWDNLVKEMGQACLSAKPKSSNVSFRHSIKLFCFRNFQLRRWRRCKLHSTHSMLTTTMRSIWRKQ